VAGLRAELARVGNNLNQVVRLAHTAGVDPDALARLEVAVDATRGAVRAVHTELAGGGSGGQVDQSASGGAGEGVGGVAT
jgi:hypothetical protein